MLKDITDFFAALTGGDKHPSQFGDDDFRLAAAALLVHVATLEGEISQVSRAKLHDLLKQRYNLDEAATAELIDAATAADRNAIDFYHFTSLLNRMLDDDGRRRIIEMMWQMAYVDGRVSEFEDNVLWRVADLLNILQRERLEIRRSVTGDRSGSNDG